MSPELNLIVEPPAQTRVGASSADSEIVLAMVKQVKPGVWVSDGHVTKSAKEAGNDAGVYRRALAKALNVGEHTIKTKVWGLDKKGSIIGDRSIAGDWRFALSVDPTRTRRTRTTAASNGS